jgi:steroid delta-isomerase-like uncharacterized protein
MLASEGEFDMPAKDVVSAYFKAFNKHDAEAVAGLFAKSGTYIDSAVPSGVKGEAFKTYLRGHYAAFPDGRYRLLRTIEGRGGFVAFEWRFTGTNSGALGTTPATNRPVDICGSSMVQVRNGKIAWLHGYYDRRSMLKQLGV